MFLEDIQILNVDVCVQETGKFVAQTLASVNLTEILPYLNAMIPRADYNPNAHSIKFAQNKVEFTIVNNQINLQKFCNRTELMELLDWVQDLVNDLYESREEIVPRHTTRKFPPALTIYKMLPKTNCQKCGEKSCMAFAAKLNKLEVELEDCPPLNEPEYRLARDHLEQAFA